MIQVPLGLFLLGSFFLTGPQSSDIKCFCSFDGFPWGYETHNFIFSANVSVLSRLFLMLCFLLKLMQGQDRLYF